MTPLAVGMRLQMRARAKKYLVDVEAPIKVHLQSSKAVHPNVGALDDRADLAKSRPMRRPTPSSRPLMASTHRYAKHVKNPKAEISFWVSRFDAAMAGAMPLKLSLEGFSK